MKEAAGEANMTVIVVVLIGVIAAVGLRIVPELLDRTKFRSCCNEVGGSIDRCQGSEAYSQGRVCCRWNNLGSDGNRSMKSILSECVGDN